MAWFRPMALQGQLKQLSPCHVRRVLHRKNVHGNRYRFGAPRLPLRMARTFLLSRDICCGRKPGYPGAGAHAYYTPLVNRIRKIVYVA